MTKPEVNSEERNETKTKEPDEEIIGYVTAQRTSRSFCAKANNSSDAKQVVNRSDCASVGDTTNIFNTVDT